jgi:hypothetical protein
VKIALIPLQLYLLVRYDRSHLSSQSSNARRSNVRECDAYFSLAVGWIGRDGVGRQAARGEGVKSVAGLSRVLEEATSGPHRILQKYMQAPLLVRGRKVDVRQWVLLTSAEPLQVGPVHTHVCLTLALPGPLTQPQPPAAGMVLRREPHTICWCSVVAGARGHHRRSQASVQPLAAVPAGKLQHRRRAGRRPEHVGLAAHEAVLTRGGGLGRR